MKKYATLLGLLAVLVTTPAWAQWGTDKTASIQPAIVAEGYFDMPANPATGVSAFIAGSIGVPSAPGSYMEIEAISGGSLFWTTGLSGVTSGCKTDYRPVGNNTQLGGFFELPTQGAWENVKIIAGAIATRCYWRLYNVYPYK